MRTALIYILLALVISAQSVMAGPYLHSLDGTKVELQISDSVVSVLFVPPAPDSSAFAHERPELRDDGPVYGPGGLHTFAIEPGLNPVSVMQELRTDPRVLMVNPVLDDGQGHERWMNDRLIVRFKDGVPITRIDSLNRVLAAHVDLPDPDEPMLYFMNVRPDLQLSTIDIAELYYETGLCRYTQPNFIWQPISWGSDDWAGGDIPPPDSTPPPPPDTFYARQWHWDNQRQTGGTRDADIDADSAWLVTKGNSSVRVAILERCFYIDHEDVDSLTRIIGYDRVGKNYRYPQPDSIVYSENIYAPDNWCAHGTSILGELAAAHSNGKGLRGLAPHCTYLAIKMSDDQGWTTDTLMSYALRDAWALLGCQIVSLSWGIAEPAPMIEAQLDTMYRSNILVLSASGNTYGGVYFPATLPSVTAVGSTDHSDVVWSYSGKGPELDIVAPSGNTNKTAPLGYIWTWDGMGKLGNVPSSEYPLSVCPDSNYYCKFGGTSAAAPMVAGVAALILSLRPDFMDSTDRVGILRRVLESSAEDKGAAGWDPEYGYGRVNAYRALLSVCDCPNQGDVDTVNSPGVVDVMDVIREIEIAFGSGVDITDPTCPRSRGDVNNDMVTDVFDVIQIIAIAFSSGSACNPCTPGVPAGCP